MATRSVCTVTDLPAAWGHPNITRHLCEAPTEVVPMAPIFSSNEALSSPALLLHGAAANEGWDLSELAVTLLSSVSKRRAC